MQRDRCAYLRDIDEATVAIFRFVSGIDRTEFEANDLIRSGVERKFEIIGEALRQVSTLYPQSVDSLPNLREVVGQRNRIAHGYFEVDPLILWSSIQTDLYPFQESVRLLLARSCE